jgi:uncharacterized protein (DUF3820 family)
MATEYTDSTPFPFGKHKNKAMANVPAEYLIWCRDNINNLDPGLKAYINANMQGLQQEMSKHKKR